MDEQKIDILIFVHEEQRYNFTRGISRDPNIDEHYDDTAPSQGRVERRSVALSELQTKILQVNAAVESIWGALKGTRLGLDEIEVSLEMESSGALGWVFGKASGGFSLTFKVKDK